MGLIRLIKGEKGAGQLLVLALIITLVALLSGVVILINNSNIFPLNNETATTTIVEGGGIEVNHQRIDSYLHSCPVFTACYQSASGDVKFIKIVYKWKGSYRVNALGHCEKFTQTITNCGPAEWRANGCDGTIAKYVKAVCMPNAGCYQMQAIKHCGYDLSKNMVWRYDGSGVIKESGIRVYYRFRKKIKTGRCSGSGGCQFVNIQVVGSPVVYNRSGMSENFAASAILLSDRDPIYKCLERDSYGLCKRWEIIGYTCNNYTHSYNKAVGLGGSFFFYLKYKTMFTPRGEGQDWYTDYNSYTVTWFPDAKNQKLVMYLPLYKVGYQTTGYDCHRSYCCGKWYTICHPIREFVATFKYFKYQIIFNYNMYRIDCYGSNPNEYKSHYNCDYQGAYAGNYCDSVSGYCCESYRSRWEANWSKTVTEETVIDSELKDKLYIPVLSPNNIRGQHTIHYSYKTYDFKDKYVELDDIDTTTPGWIIHRSIPVSDFIKNATKYRGICIPGEREEIRYVKNSRGRREKFSVIVPYFTAYVNRWNTEQRIVQLETSHDLFTFYDTTQYLANSYQGTITPVFSNYKIYATRGFYRGRYANQWHLMNNEIVVNDMLENPQDKELKNDLALFDKTAYASGDRLWYSLRNRGDKYGFIWLGQTHITALSHFNVPVKGCKVNNGFYKEKKDTVTLNVNTVNWFYPLQIRIRGESLSKRLKTLLTYNDYVYLNDGEGKNVPYEVKKVVRDGQYYIGESYFDNSDSIGKKGIVAGTSWFLTALPIHNRFIVYKSFFDPRVEKREQVQQCAVFWLGPDTYDRWFEIKFPTYVYVDIGSRQKASSLGGYINYYIYPHTDLIMRGFACGQLSSNIQKAYLVKLKCWANGAYASNKSSDAECNEVFFRNASSPYNGAYSFNGEFGWHTCAEIERLDSNNNKTSFCSGASACGVNIYALGANYGDPYSVVFQAPGIGVIVPSLQYLSCYSPDIVKKENQEEGVVYHTNPVGGGVMPQ